MSRNRSNNPNPLSGHIENESTAPCDYMAQPPGCRFSPELIAQARTIFQRRTDRLLTQEDARQILENLVGFFDTLIQCERSRKKTRSAPES